MSPEQRVEAFIADFRDAWARAKERKDAKVDFDLWRRMVRELEERHFEVGRRSGAEGAFRTPAEHSPDTERVIRVNVSGASALVETRSSCQFIDQFFEYELALRDGDWRITGLMLFLDKAGKPMVPEQNQAALLAQAREDAPLEPLPEGVEIDGEKLFETGRLVTRYGKSQRTEVRDVGRLELASGIIGVCDFGYDAYEFTPLARRVPPGDYPVQVLLAFGRVAAVRVRLSEARTAAWRAAERASGGHVVGVDAANVAIFDARAYVRLETRAKERLYHRHVVEGEAPVACLFTLETGTDCALTESGEGDGAYPCYWGVDAQGRPTALVVDYLMLAEFPESKAMLDWAYRSRARALEAPRGVSVWLNEASSGSEFIAKGDHFKRARVLDAGGEVLMDTDAMGLSMRGDERRYAWDRSLESLDRATIEVICSEPYRSPAR